MSSSSNIVICSFFTDDEYYSAHGERLRSELDALGLSHVIEPMEKKPGEQWPDICRKKVGFIAKVCAEHPNSRVFWIDVDCGLRNLPAWVANSTADVIGFQRGFSDPLRIGYANRTRFWEPCFWGVAPTPAARQFIDDAFELEQSTKISATDDYFFEEAWRRNAASMSFQIIPSKYVWRNDKFNTQDLEETFFQFGSSGKVDEYKDDVVQHKSPFRRRNPISRFLSRDGLFIALFHMRGLAPAPIRPALRNAAAKVGLTQRIIQSVEEPSDHFERMVVRYGQCGDRKKIEKLVSSQGGEQGLSKAQKKRLSQARAFAAYREGERPVLAAWWTQPAPGNFGDWLSPLVIRKSSNRPVQHVPVMNPGSAPHIFAIGSIGRFIQPNSIVVGTGISRRDAQISPSATYVSLRGPLSAKRLVECGGKSPDRFGDPALALSRLIPIDREIEKGKVGLVRHYTHRSLNLKLPDNVKELDILVSEPADVEKFLKELCSCEYILSSAMHGLIACHSYQIPCGLISFDSASDTVHGDGMKYHDYYLGAGLRASDPVVISQDLRGRDLENLIGDSIVKDTIIDDVVSQIYSALAIYSERENPNQELVNM